MLILGILLIIVALVVFGYMFFGTSDLPAMDIDLGIFTVQLTPLHLYLLGAATLAVLALGLLTLFAGLRASRRRRHEVKELRKAVRDGDAPRGERPSARSDRSDTRQTTDYEREVPPPAPAPDGQTHGTHTATGTAPTSGTGGDDPRIALPSDYPDTTAPREYPDTTASDDRPGGTPPDGPRRA